MLLLIGGINRMKREDFFNWYFSLDLNPMSNDVIATCVKNDDCKQCKMREKCPIRPLFFIEDDDFDAYVKMAEEFVKIQNISGQLAEELLDEFVSKFIEKRETELENQVLKE